MVFNEVEAMAYSLLIQYALHLLKLFDTFLKYLTCHLTRCHLSQGLLNACKRDQIFGIYSHNFPSFSSI